MHGGIREITFMPVYIHGSDKLGWLFLHDFIKNFGKYTWLLA